MYIYNINAQSRLHYSGVCRILIIVSMMLNAGFIDFIHLMLEYNLV